MTVNLKIGYARVSREDQNLDLQMQALLKNGVDEKQIFAEKISGVSKKRPQFALCLKRLRKGDTLVVWKLDRLGRSVKELCMLAEQFKDRGIELVIITEGVDTSTAFGRFFYHLMASLAQFERDMVSERSVAGVAAAKVRGTWRSRPVSFSEAQWNKALKIVSKNPTMSIREIARQSGMKAGTVYKHMEKIAAGTEWMWGDNTVENQKKRGKK